MLIELLKKRTSVRNFSDKDISDEDLEYILEAGCLSPSGGNEQPWLFGVIKEKDIINEISNIAYKQKWIKNAPLIIVLCTKVVSDRREGRNIQIKRFPELKEKIYNMDKKLYSKINLEEHQTKIPGTHMVLAALEKGIGSTWVSYFKVGELSKQLNLPDNIIPSEILAFGYSQEKPEPKRKKDINDIVFYNNYMVKK